MTYTVRPKKYHPGYCPTICDTKESAEEQLALMHKHTTFEWEIVDTELDCDEEKLQCIENEEHVRLYQRYYDDEDPGYRYADDDEDEGTKFRVAITYEAWNGEQTTEHEYDSASQAAAVYERVCRICEHKGYRRLGYGECWSQVFEVSEDKTYSIELY